MSGSITLHLPNHIVLAGSRIEGQVELDFPLVQQEQLEEVHVKLRGSVCTFISQARTNLNETLDLDLVRDEQSVWTRGSAYPRPDSHVLRLPFAFRVPAKGPPSFHAARFDTEAVVRYAIEAIGVRPGTLRANKRVIRPFVVLPVDQAGAAIRSALQLGWDGVWSRPVVEKKIRAGIWGEHAHVKLELKIPSLNTFPLFVPVPYTVKISTVSKSMKRTDGVEMKPIWPAPPTDPKDVRFELRRITQLVTRHYSWQEDENVVALGGMYGSTGQVDVKTQHKEWMASAENPSKGTWKQETVFSSVFVLTCPPTFVFPSLSIDYRLLLQVHFSRWQNDVSMRIPITISSGLVPPPAPAYSDYAVPPPDISVLNMDDDNYVLPPSTLDLPPSYWNATDAAVPAE